MTIAAIQTTAWSYVLDEPTKLLVADDDPILCEFASVHLSSPAATVETVQDGASALARLTEGQFDLVLLDIEMPSLDGFALLERIRSDPKLCTLPVIMLTGHEDIASVDRAFSLGANSFVSKPVNWRLLSYHVRYVLRTSRAARELRQARVEAEAQCQPSPHAACARGRMRRRAQVDPAAGRTGARRRCSAAVRAGVPPSH